jgi:hypothetical protein
MGQEARGKPICGEVANGIWRGRANFTAAQQQRADARAAEHWSDHQSATGGWRNELESHCSRAQRARQRNVARRWRMDRGAGRARTGAALAKRWMPWGIRALSICDLEPPSLPK